MNDRSVCTKVSAARRLLVVAVVAAGLAIPSSVAAGVAEATPGMDATPSSSAEAMAEARATGHKVEDISQRTETTEVFANPDGTWTLDSAAEPVRAQDDNGDWHAIDLSLVHTDHGYAPRYAPTDIEISDGGDRDFATLTDESRQLAFTWHQDLPTPEIDGATATYKNVAPGQDLVVTATATGFEDSLVINEQPAGPVDFTTGVEIDGAKIAETAAGGAVVKDGSEVVASIPQPTVYDASGPADTTDANVTTANAELSGTQASGQELTVRADAGFLQDPGTQYPVTIDPLVSQAFTTGDTWIQKGSTTNQGTNPELQVGTNDGGTHKSRALMRFDFSDNDGDGTGDWFDNKTITAADLVMFNDYSGTCNAHQITASRIYQPWFFTSVTWDNQPSGGGEPAGFTPAYGAPGGTCGGGGYAHWDVTGIVNAWAHGSENDGIRLVAYNEDNNNSFRHYYSANHPNTPTSLPHINITYTDHPNTPTSTGFTPCLDECDPTWAFTNSLTPTLSATSRDEDTPTIWFNWQIQDDATGTLVASGTTTAPQGGVDQWQVPSGKLQDQIVYDYRVMASDGVGSSWTDWLPLGVDVDQAPFAPGSIAYTPCPGDDCSSNATSSLTPLLSAQVSDPDSDPNSLATDFQIRSAQTQQLVASGVAYGEQPTWTPPSGSLQWSQSYEYRLGARDATSETWTEWSPIATTAAPAVLAPTNFKLQNCEDSCTAWVTPDVTPTFTATSVGPVGADLLLELDSASQTMTLTASNIAPGSTATWTVPAGTLGSDTYEARVGTQSGLTTTWTASVPFVIDTETATGTLPAAPTLDVTPVPADNTTAETTDNPSDPSRDTADTAPASTFSDSDLVAQDQMVSQHEASAYAIGMPQSSAQYASTIPVWQKYAPVLHLYPGEKYNPIGASTEIDHSELKFAHDDYCPDDKLAHSPSEANLANLHYEDREAYSYKALCVKHGEEWAPSSPSVDVGNDNGGPGGREGYYLDLADHIHDGYGFQGNEPMYYGFEDLQQNLPPGWHALEYWFAYAYNAPPASWEKFIDHHEGDWEHITVVLDSNYSAKRVVYTYHHASCWLPWTGTNSVPKTNSHPKIEVAYTTHASYPEGFDAAHQAAASWHGIDFHDRVSTWPTHDDGWIWRPSASVLKPVHSQSWWGYNGNWGSIGLEAVSDSSGPTGPSVEKDENHNMLPRHRCGLN